MGFDYIGAHNRIEFRTSVVYNLTLVQGRKSEADNGGDIMFFFLTAASP